MEELAKYRTAQYEPARYTLKIKDWDRGGFRLHIIDCLVVGESKSQYKIRLSQPTHNRRAGDELWVRKHNVEFKNPPVKEINYWQNIY